MNRDTTIIQVTILVIALAILWVAIWRQQQPEISTRQTQTTPTPIQLQEEQRNPVILTISGDLVLDNNTSSPRRPQLVENENQDKANLVKAYFAHMQAREFQQACALMAPGKCAAIRPAAVEAFSQEFRKFAHGYEYINVRDYGIKSPSGKDVVCVKYSYRYINDTNPWLISEILSFYIEEDVGKRVITDRVCEKKYKEGVGVTRCPIQALQNFCVDKIR